MNNELLASEAHAADLRIRILTLKKAERNGELSCCAECSGLNDLEWDLVMTEEHILEIAA